ncbi:MAG: hypothetical protein RLZZ271_1492 [Pseudomonadota bacterium]|jgi:hemerythrin
MTEVAEHKKHAFTIDWRDGFKINVPEVDREHKHLFALVKALDINTIEETINELLDYVVTHFTNEQALMEKSGYPAFEQHLKLHEEFSAQVADFLGSGDDWTEDRVDNLRRFLNRWLIGHIMTHDLRFGKWYQEHLQQALERMQQARAAATQRPVAAAPQQGSGFFGRLFGR